MIRAGVAVVRRPGLWVTALRLVRRTAPPGWWRSRPFLPVPPAEYVRFRLLTQYGDPDHRWVPGDVVRYLEWCKSWETAS